MTTPKQIEAATHAIWNIRKYADPAWVDSSQLAQAALDAAEAAAWEPIETAPKDGTIIDVWLGDADASDVEFYCGRDTRRSASWRWLDGKWRPEMGLVSVPMFVVPTHWRPLPKGPRAAAEGGGGGHSTGSTIGSLFNRARSPAGAKIGGG